MKWVFWLALILTFSPGEKEQQAALSDYSSGPANPAASFHERATNVSPSPGGEGRGEGGRETNSALPLSMMKSVFGSPSS
jgi:hypothetical protein